MRSAKGRIIVFFVSLFCASAAGQPPRPEMLDLDTAISWLIDRECDVTGRKFSVACIAVGDFSDDRIPGLLKTRQMECGDTSLPLLYALAAQGDYQSAGKIVDLLSHGDKTSLFALKRLRFGNQWYNSRNEEALDANEMSAWFRAFSESEYKIWSQNRLLTTHPRHEIEIRPGEILTTVQIDNLPTHRARRMFEQAIVHLQNEGNRKLAEAAFRNCATKYPLTIYTSHSLDLAEELERLTQEDARWVEPPSIDLLTAEERVTYWIYHLRNTVVYQHGYQGLNSGQFIMPIQVLWDSEERAPNAALKLQELGELAVPKLLNMLSDRRPMPAVVFLHDAYRPRHILRNQDAAFEIVLSLNQKGLGRDLVNGYFSQMDEDVQCRVISLYRTWWRESQR